MHPSPLADSLDPRLRPSTELADARAVISACPTEDPEVGAYRDRMLRFLDTHPDALHRSCAEGHLTGSALVLDAASKRILVLFHRKVRRWLQPGGHADGDANLAAVALREATEETGIDQMVVDVVPIDLDVHRFRSANEPDHDHLDVRFLVLAPPGAVPVANHESEGLQWVTLDRLGEIGVDPGTVRMARAGLARLQVVTGRLQVVGSDVAGGHAPLHLVDPGEAVDGGGDV